jgi:hypothetical protein
LNTRVDTARDLVLKLFNTTNEMVKTSMLAEMALFMEIDIKVAE